MSKPSTHEVELERPPTVAESAGHLAVLVEDLREQMEYDYDPWVAETTMELQAVVTGLLAAESVEA